MRLFFASLIVLNASFAALGQISLPVVKSNSGHSAEQRHHAASRTCGSHDKLLQNLAANPQLLEQRNKHLKNMEQWVTEQDGSSRVVVTIPVVVHVVYKNSTENISDAQIQSQITALNEDFRKLNADASLVPSVWQNIAADIEIQFCLAQRTPTGTATNGITRTATTVQGFSTNDEVKSSSTGGRNAWNTDDYLNMWVCDLTGGLLGYAQFPNGGSAATDGIVVGFENFGTIGTASAPYNKGRTATHEVGHWLDLFHIWGDEPSCSADDLVNDTPQQKDSNGGCPSFPLTTGPGGSCSGSNGAMFMNYMDYVNDGCMYMFTNGQKNRMLAALNNVRTSLLSSQGCVPPGGGTTQSCDTIGNFLDTHTGQLYRPSEVGATGTGWVSGTNSFLDKSKADKYTTYPVGYRVKGLFIGFGYVYALSGANTVLVNVWNSSGPSGDPGMIIGSGPLTMSTIANNISQGNASYYEFTTPVVVSGPFYAGVTFNPTSGDSIAIITNTDGESFPGTAYEQWDNNVWYPYSATPASWGIDVAHFIYPVMCNLSPSSSEEENNEGGWSVYPNPSNGGEVLVGWNPESIQPSEIRLFDAGGKMLMQDLLPNAGNVYRFDTSSLAQGLYFVRMVSRDGVVRQQKLIIN